MHVGTNTATQIILSESHMSHQPHLPRQPTRKNSSEALKSLLRLSNLVRHTVSESRGLFLSLLCIRYSSLHVLLRQTKLFHRDKKINHMYAY